MTIAARHNMPGLSLRLAAMLHGRDGRMSHAGMYPVPDWRPENGFNVDQALLLAIARARRTSMCAPKAVVAPAG